MSDQVLEEYIPKNVLLKNVPKDVNDIIIDLQASEKKKRGTLQYSISSTLFKIVKEWKNRCKPVE